MIIIFRSPTLTEDMSRDAPFLISIFLALSTVSSSILGIHNVYWVNVVKEENGSK